MNILKWLDERTGFWTVAKAIADLKVPAKRCCCRYMPTALIFMFLIQALTGGFLWVFYSPSTTSAWESVFYIQYVLPLGWLLRGIHHYSAQLFVLTGGFYLLSLVVHGAYRRPREFVYWSALVMFLFALCSCLTGDLLPWSQSGYFATITRVSFLQLLPVIGVPLYQLVVGGPDPQFGSLTLTRFLFLHVGVFGGGGLVVLCLWKYFDIRSRNLFITESRFGDIHTCGLACASKKRRYFWSWEAFLTGGICWVVLCAVLVLVFQHSLTSTQIAERVPTLPAQAYLGAELTAPVDVSSSYDAARPEWSFRALYHMTKLPIFSKIGMVYAIFVVPPCLLLFFFALPILGRVRPLHYLCVVLTSTFFIFVCVFTYLSYADDYKALWKNTPTEGGKASLEGEEMIAGEESQELDHSLSFLESVAKAKRTADRVVELAFAPTGIPKSGALELIKNDAFLQGPILFNQHCASCHNFVARSEMAKIPDYDEIPCVEPSAPNLYGAHSAEWIRGFTDIETLVDTDFFGNTAFVEKGSMIGFMKSRVWGGSKLEDGSFILNSNGLIAKIIAADASPAFDILESVFEDFCGEDKDLELLDCILNEDDEFDEDAVKTAQYKYVARLTELLTDKFNDSGFIVNLEPKLPEPVLPALKNVLLKTLADETYIELLIDEDNITLVKDGDYDEFLTETYLATLSGNNEPIALKDQKYINELRTAIIASCDSIADILAEEANLKKIRPMVDGEYLGLATHAIPDMEFLTCTECHAFYGKENNNHACDLRGYMSRDWIAGFIADPTQTRFYGKNNDRMPSYHPSVGDALMSEREVEMLADWLSGIWYRAPKVENSTRTGISGAAKMASIAQAKIEAEIAVQEAEQQVVLEKKIAEQKIADAEKERIAKEKLEAATVSKAKKEMEEKIRIQNELIETKSTLEKVKSDAKVALDKADLEAKLIAERAQITLQKVSTDAQDKVKRANEATDILSQKLTMLENELDTTKTENSALHSENDQLKADFKKCNIELQQSVLLKKEIESQNALMKEEFDAQVKTLSESLEQAKVQLNSAQDETNTLREQLQLIQQQSDHSSVE